MKHFRFLELAVAAAMSLMAVGAPMVAVAADLVITATSVQPGAGAKTLTGVAGEAITAGQTLYEASTGKMMKSDSDSATAAVRSVKGIALHAASLNQPVTYQYDGPLTLGATLTVGAPYFLSNTAGGIIPFADLSTGEYPVLLGFATTTGVLDVTIVPAGVATP